MGEEVEPLPTVEVEKQAEAAAASAITASAAARAFEEKGGYDAGAPVGALVVVVGGGGLGLGAMGCIVEEGWREEEGKGSRGGERGGDCENPTDGRRPGGREDEGCIPPSTRKAGEKA